MKERPILFSSAMVRALLDGTKTQTRRVIKNPERFDGYMLEGEGQEWCPYGRIGDRLWVRETWGSVRMHEIGQHIYRGPRIPDRDEFVYRAGRVVGIPPKDGPITMDRFTTEIRDDIKPARWRPSIHMPRSASRITLEITGIRVERVQHISREDAIAEGIAPRQIEQPITDYRALWNKINSKRGYSWESNPWVWVIEFSAGVPQ